MLVLSRQRDESIIIGDDIVVTVISIRGDIVKLGIDCPPQIPVHRSEVYDAIQRENFRASQSKGSELEGSVEQTEGQLPTLSSIQPDTYQKPKQQHRDY